MEVQLEARVARDGRASIIHRGREAQRGSACARSPSEALTSRRLQQQSTQLRATAGVHLNVDAHLRVIRLGAGGEVPATRIDGREQAGAMARPEAPRFARVATTGTRARGNAGLGP